MKLKAGIFSIILHSDGESTTSAVNLATLLAKVLLHEPKRGMITDRSENGHDSDES